MDQRSFSFCHPPPSLPPKLNSFSTLCGVTYLELCHVLFESHVVKVGNIISNIQIIVILILQILSGQGIHSNY